MAKGEDLIPISVRMPRTAAERLRAATGMPVSTLARYVLMELLKRAEAKAVNQRNVVAGEISDIVKEMPE